MKVVKWIERDDRDDTKYPKIVGGLGGFFKEGMRWDDYLKETQEDWHPYVEAIRQSAIENNIRITGKQHQYGDSGMPIFEDGAAGMFSYRAWGDLMAAIWSEAENKDYSYMNFYM